MSDSDTPCLMGSPPASASTDTTVPDILALYSRAGTTPTPTRPATPGPCEAPAIVEYMSSGPATPGPREAPAIIEYMSSDGLVRASPDGTVKAVMSPGPEGFALATFPGEAAKTTEMPNLCLAAQPKKRFRIRGKSSDAVILKHPAGEGPAMKRPAGAAAFGLMFYKRSASFGVRQRHGGQVVSVAKKGVPVEALRALAEQAVVRLESGEPVDSVKAWVKADLAAR